MAARLATFPRRLPSFTLGNGGAFRAFCVPAPGPLRQAAAAGQAVAQALGEGGNQTQAYAKALSQAVASGGCGSVSNVLARKPGTRTPALTCWGGVSFSKALLFASCTCCAAGTNATHASVREHTHLRWLWLKASVQMLAPF
jgi:hypothetical protein